MLAGFWQRQSLAFHYLSHEIVAFCSGAAAVASLINCFDPEVFLIGGGISNAWEFIEPGLDRWLDQYEWRPGGHRVPVLRAILGEWAGCHGALHFALTTLKS